MICKMFVITLIHAGCTGHACSLGSASSKLFLSEIAGTQDSEGKGKLLGFLEQGVLFQGTRRQIAPESPVSVIRDHS